MTAIGSAKNSTYNIKPKCYYFVKEGNNTCNRIEDYTCVHSIKISVIIFTLYSIIIK